MINTPQERIAGDVEPNEEEEGYHSPYSDIEELMDNQGVEEVQSVSSLGIRNIWDPPQPSIEHNENFYHVLGVVDSVDVLPGGIKRKDYMESQSRKKIAPRTTLNMLFSNICGTSAMDTYDLGVITEEEEEENSDMENNIIPKEYFLTTSEEEANEEVRDLERMYKQKRREKRHRYRRNKYIRTAHTMTHWLRYLGAVDALEDFQSCWKVELNQISLPPKPPQEENQILLQEELPQKLSRAARRKLNKTKAELIKEEKEAVKQVKEELKKEDLEKNKTRMPHKYQTYLVGRRELATPCETKSQSNQVYEGPPLTKEINLAKPGEEPRPIFISDQLSLEDEEKLISLIKANEDCFAWTYKDMKGVPPEVVKHTIPLIEGARPVVQKPYHMNPHYADEVRKEIQKLIDADFIYEIEHTPWVSPIVIVRKKNGKLRVCVDLKKLNAATVRDHYPLPNMDQLLERVAGKEAYSFLDGFSGYNQILIDPADQYKTAFATPWGTFAFKVMPFGLTNAPSTFQRLMATAFRSLLGQFLEVYLDDLCVNSTWDEHLIRLEEVFKICRRYQISLNPLKCQFWVKHGVILGHIISKNGIATDTSKIKLILELPPPTTKKEVQRFMGHAGYYRRFILAFADLA